MNDQVEGGNTDLVFLCFICVTHGLFLQKKNQANSFGVEVFFKKTPEMGFNICSETEVDHKFCNRSYTFL